MKIFKHFTQHIQLQLYNSLFEELEVIKHAAHVTGKGHCLLHVILIKTMFMTLE